jgi:hypothetical protein
MTTIVDPTRIFEVNGQVCPLLTYSATVPVSTNTQLVAAVTGKRIRVMGYALQTNDASLIGVIEFLDGSGGARKDAVYAPVRGQQREKLPIVDSGYFETTTATGLFANVSVASVFATVFYIVYTP